MGTAIEAYMETQAPNGTWSAAGRTNIHPYSDLFAAMAGLPRLMDYNFQPIRGVGIPPIAKARGFPANASAEVTDAWDNDGHTPSYLTLADLQAYDMEQPCYTNGSWDTSLHAELKKWHFKVPESTRKAQAQQLYNHLQGHGPAPELDGITVEQGLAILKRHQWLIEAGKLTPFQAMTLTFMGTIYASTVRQEVGDTLFDLMNDMAKLGPPDKVRLVFWFDC